MIGYTRKFYEGQRDRSRSSAQTIVPILNKFIQPKTVIDIGCGTGAWLSVFMEMGIQDVTGLDGEWVEKDMLLIPDKCFVKTDLQRLIRMDRQFDLVMCMEVAEHLPSECAAGFVDSLTGLGPVILFSAAIPGQGGAHHVNEQWPAYWVKLFQARGFGVIDCIRKRIWQDENVEWWYAQNTLLFVQLDCLKQYPLLQRELDDSVLLQLNLVHPKLYLAAREPSGMSLRRVFPALPALVMKSVRRTLTTCMKWFSRSRVF